MTLRLNEEMANLLATFYPYAAIDIFREYEIVKSWDKIIDAMEYAGKVGMSSAYRLSKIVAILDAFNASNEYSRGNSE